MENIDSLRDKIASCLQNPRPNDRWPTSLKLEFLETLEKSNLPLVRFCKNIGLSPRLGYSWRRANRRRLNPQKTDKASPPIKDQVLLVEDPKPKNRPVTFLLKYKRLTLEVK